MAYPTTRMQMGCPNCGQLVNVTVQQVIDVGDEPMLKERLLRGRLNVMRCPQCSFSAPVGAPLLYHDPEHRLMLAFVPQQLNLTMEQEEREIGRLSNLILERTPAEQRKMYMLDPTRMLTYDALLEKVLESEGIDPDQMRRQTEKIQLLTRLAQQVDAPERLRQSIAANEALLDQDALLLVTATLQQATEMGDAALAERYRTLQQALVEQVGLSVAALPTMSAEGQYDALIEALLETPDERLQAMVAANRPLLDYPFFMHLTQRADEAAEAADKQRLLALRTQVVTLTERMDKEAEQAMQRGAQQLQTLLEAEDIDAAIQGMYHELDEAFLVVLSANVEQARGQGRDDIVEMLMRIYQRVVEAMESRMRPELQAMNKLLRTDSAEERQAQLRQELQTYNPAGFIEMVEAIAGDLEDSGRTDPTTLERLYLIADEAREIAAMMEGSFSPPTVSLFGDEPKKTSGPGILLP